MDLTEVVQVDSAQGHRVQVQLQHGELGLGRGGLDLKLFEMDLARLTCTPVIATSAHLSNLLQGGAVQPVQRELTPPWRFLKCGQFLPASRKAREGSKKGKSSEFNPRNDAQVKSSPALKVWVLTQKLEKYMTTIGGSGAKFRNKLDLGAVVLA